MSRIHTLALAAIAAASLHGAASAAALYAGAAIGQSDYRIDTTGASSADTTDTAGKVYLGTTITRHLGVEAAVFDLGRTTGSIFVPGAGTVNASAQVRGLGISGVFSAPVGPVSLFAKAGIAYVRASAEANVSTGLPGSESSWQPTVGLGVSYPLAGQLAVRGEWERVRARFPGDGEDHVDLLSVGLSYRF
ncbi:outer membrane protein [Rubrivivax sp. RP6-9]|uniref:outer membrane protein n=1 Tax=Rubrivivax sp. RP6-9 TaxID=3415750 RepID=UPI003CC5B59B